MEGGLGSRRVHHLHPQVALGTDQRLEQVRPVGGHVEHVLDESAVAAQQVGDLILADLVIVGDAVGAVDHRRVAVGAHQRDPLRGGGRHPVGPLPQLRDGGIHGVGGHHAVGGVLAAGHHHGARGDGHDRVLARQFGGGVRAAGQQRPQPRVDAAHVLTRDRFGEHGVHVAEDVVDVRTGGGRMGEVELPVGVGGADDPVLAPGDDEKHGLLGAQDQRRLRVDLVAVHHDVHALRRADGEAALLAEHPLELVGPHSGGVEHGAGPHVGLEPGLGVPDAHAGDPLTVTQVADHLRGVGHHGAVARGGAGQCEGVAGVVDECVPVADAADHHVLAQAGRDAVGAGAAVVLLWGYALGPAHDVVEHESGGHVGALPEATGQREQEFQGCDQVWGQAGHAEFALVQGFGDQAEVELLEVAQAPVEHLGAARGGACGEISGLDHGDVQSAGGGVDGAAGAHDATAHYHDVERLLGQPAPCLGSALGAEDGSGPDRGHGWLPPRPG